MKYKQSGNMQMKDAFRLKKECGNKPCNHPNLDKEYHLGSSTGDYVCTQCGETGWGKDWPLKEKLAIEKDKM